MYMPFHRFSDEILLPSICFQHYTYNRPFAASHSHGTKPPCWRAKVALGQDKQRKLPFQIMYVFCLSCPSATFALQRGSFVRREWPAAKGLFVISSLPFI